MQTVYILSGPAGVGKSTTSSALVNVLKNSAYISGDVVIDYVTFPDEANWLKDKLKELTENVVYVVLWTDHETLLKRDQFRLPEHQMGDRCLILIKEFKESVLNNKHLLDTSQKNVDAIHLVIEEIMNNNQYRIDD